MENDEEDAFVFVYDRRTSSNKDKQKIHIGGVFSFDVFREKILQKFSVKKHDKFIITTTGRNTIYDDDTFVTLIESGDTLYLLKYLEQPLEAPVSEKIEFQPHYDTLIKGGIYEYYASEGHVNPLPFAFAELIDNALAATVKNRGPRNIELSVHLNEINGKHALCVYDNGEGMSSRQLNNWAIYRLSKFNRNERHERVNIFDNDGSISGGTVDQDSSDNAPKSLNSDISWFGVGGKQAIFFIGNSTRIITKPRGSCDVHEFTMSKDEFRRREKNREAIFAGFIRNRKPGDCSHIPKGDKMTKDFVQVEGEAAFTRVIVGGLNSSHISFLKCGFEIWTRQLAHIYHYYIHGPEGNTALSRSRKNVGALDVNIKVSLHENGAETFSVDLCDVEDDLESRHIRTASDSFEFQAEVDGGVVEGILRYHPFLYDRETYPVNTANDGDDDNDDYSDFIPARGRRPIFECFWNGRLIPYTFIDDFDWCRVPKKHIANIPGDCFYRVSGCLFSNDKFQVSTNKLTFIDLESKLRGRNASFMRMILGQGQKAPIQKEFYDWLRDCHAKYDKQIKFLRHSKTILRSDASSSRRSQTPWTVYKAIEWDGRVFSKGHQIRTQRTVPIVCGTIKRFLLCGDYDGDVYAVGGEMEIVQEPQILYDQVRCYPLSKLDRAVSVDLAKSLIEEEEYRLPSTLNIAWPHGSKIVQDQASQAGLTIGSMRVDILDMHRQPVHKIHTNGGSGKLLVEQRLYFTPQDGEKRIELSSHVTALGKHSSYNFKAIEKLKDIGHYNLILQATMPDSETDKVALESKLPSTCINFRIKESPPYKFMVGILESPLRIAEPFDIPLEMQDASSHPTKADDDDVRPKLESEGLELNYSGVETQGNSLIIKDVTAVGIVNTQHGKTFPVTVTLPGLARPSQTLKIRLLPGQPYAVRVSSFNDGYEERHFDEDSDVDSLTFENGSDISIGVEVVDAYGNVTTQSKLIAQCKLTGAKDLPTFTCNCSQAGSGSFGGKVKLKKANRMQKIKARVEIQGNKEISPVDCEFSVMPSTRIKWIHVFHQDPNNSEDDEPTKLKQGQDIYWEAGETMENFTFQLLDESKRTVEMTERLAANIKVNWTGAVSTSELAACQLPDITVPTNVSDAKFCQVTYAGEKTVDFSFNVKPVAGEPSGLKVTIHGTREVRLGLVRQEPVSIALMDNFGNQLHIRPAQVDRVRLTAEGLDETIISKTLENDRVVISNIQFNEGPLGGRELTASYGDDIKEYAVLQLTAGSPVTLKVIGWPDVDKAVSVLSGTRLQDQLGIQLFDGWGNPAPEPGVKVLLGKDPSLKLTPAPGMLKTNENGRATFQKFSVTGKCGDYSLQPRVVYNRQAIEGPKLMLSVLPNTERPISVKVQPPERTIVQCGTKWPAFQVDVLSEVGANVTANPHVCFVVWKGKPQKDRSIPSKADWHRAVAVEGHHTFDDVKAPDQAADYTAMIGIASSATAKTLSLGSDFSLKTTAGPPSCMVPTTEPGTPTVSNAKTAFNRILVRSLKLRVQDDLGNPVCGGMDGNVVVTIQPCDQSLYSSEVPKFEGNATRLNVPLKSGEVHLQNLFLQENSPGIDGSQYVLHCEIVSPVVSVEPFMLRFLFYNDARKQAQMSALIRQRDTLSNAVKTYRETFNAHQSLVRELHQNLLNCRRKKENLVSELLKTGVPVAKATDETDVNDLVDLYVTERDALLQQPRRQCLLNEYENDGDAILGKVGQLALIEDDDVARVLSWHMAGDIDCLVTTTSQKAREVHQVTNGAQQLLPLDSVARRYLPDWNKALPHLRAGIKTKNVRGNPVYAKKLLTFPRDEESCKLVFGAFLGDTMIMDDLETANEYRKMVVKHTSCPTILTREGERIRSVGKFGGAQNKAPSLHKLGRAVFGAPVSGKYNECCRQIEMLNELKSAIAECEAAQEEKELLDESTDAEDMKKKEEELTEARGRLVEIEKKIELHQASRPPAPPRERMESDKPKKRARR